MVKRAGGDFKLPGQDHGQDDHYRHENDQELIQLLKQYLKKTENTLWYEISASVETPQTSELQADSGGYTRERIFDRLGRNAETLSLYNDGPGAWFVRVTHDGAQFTEEFPIYEGEYKTYRNVYEVRHRSPTYGMKYRITEFELVKNPQSDVTDQWGSVRGMGLAEHAARIGSPMVYDRRGNILYSDNYESSTLKFGAFTDPGGAIVRSTDFSLYGTFSLRISTGNVVDNEAYITYFHMDYHDNTKLGSQVSLKSLALISGENEFFVEMDLDDGILRHRGTILLKNNGGNAIDIFYKDSAGIYQLIDNISFTGRGFGTLKLVIDSKTRKYVRILVHGHEYDLSSYDLQPLPTTGVKELDINYNLTKRSNLIVGDEFVYLDNYILTENEQ